MFRMQDLGEIGYGGAVTLAGWWDNKRIAAATLTEKAVLKKAGFWAYWGIGLIAVLSNQFGWFRRYDAWTEHISHGFLYDVPRQVMNLIQSQRTTPNYVHYGAGDASDAVREAREIIRANSTRRQTNYEVVNPQEILV